MTRNNEANLQRAFHPTPKSLRKLASNPGWIDQDIVTIRKMNAAGASLGEIGEALGWKPGKVRYRMKRDGIALRSRPGGEGGVKRAERAARAHREHGRGVWHERARQLKAAGLKNNQIAAILGFSQQRVVHFFSTERRKCIEAMGRAT